MNAAAVPVAATQCRRGEKLADGAGGQPIAQYRPCRRIASSLNVISKSETVDTLKKVRYMSHMDFKRTYLVAEAALIAGMERDTLRVWLRRPYFDFDRPEGWKRFTYLEVMSISVFAEIVRRTKDHELAKWVASKEMDHWIGPSPFPASDCFVEFWRDDAEKLWCEVIQGEDQMMSITSNAIRTESADTMVYGFVNLSAIRSKVMDRMVAYAEGRLNEDGKVQS